ncbi:MAG: DUF3343 domain-containing protein [Bacillota bacterium]
MANNCYITFPTTYYAIRAESLLRKHTYSFKMVPVPRVISSSCGTALRCSCEDIVTLRNILIQNELQLESIYKIEEAGLRTPKAEELDFD